MMQKFRDTRRHSVEQFELALDRTNFSFITQIQNTDEAIQTLTAVLRILLDIHCPCKICPLGQQRSEAYDTIIEDSFSEARLAHRKTSLLRCGRF